MAVIGKTDFKAVWTSVRRITKYYLFFSLRVKKRVFPIRDHKTNGTPAFQPGKSYSEGQIRCGDVRGEGGKGCRPHTPTAADGPMLRKKTK
jgi:hypothetical protein